MTSSGWHTVAAPMPAKADNTMRVARGTFVVEVLVVVAIGGLTDAVVIFTEEEEPGKGWIAAGDSVT